MAVSRTFRLALLGVLLVVAGGTAMSHAAVAQAAAYTVNGCQSSSTPLDGWHVVRAPDSYWQGKCPGVMFLWMAANQSHADGAVSDLEFVAPANTTIQAYTIWRAVRLVAGKGYYWQILDDSAGVWTLADGCRSASGCGPVGSTTNLTNPANHFTHRAEPDTTAIEIKLVCGASGGCPAVGSGANSFWFIHSAVALNDNSAPQFSAQPSGPLVAPGAVLSGVAPVTITGSDQGGGVYQAIINVDGHTLQKQVLDSHGGLCASPFVAIVPCQLSASGTIDVNTAALPDGSHTLTLELTDPAGNVGFWGPVTIHTLNNPCLPGPSGAGQKISADFVTRVSRRVRVGRRLTRVTRSKLVPRLTTSYGAHPTISGRLTTTTGAPVGNAAVCVAAQANSSNASVVPVGQLTTSPTGTFRWRLGSGPSRTVYLIHRLPGGAIADTLHLTVRVPVRVHVNHRRLRNGQVMTWSGRLPGPIASGLLGLMQVWRGTRWQTFQQVSIARTGKWKAGYRFLFTTGSQPYTFRLLIPHQTGYPYAANASKRIHVIVSG